MPNHALAMSLILSGVLAAGSADASPCGKQATTMLRYFNPALSNPGPRIDRGGAASTNSTRAGAVPITSDQQRRASVLVQKAASEDQAGNVAGCTKDLAAAKAIIKYNK